MYFYRIDYYYYYYYAWYNLLIVKNFIAKLL